MSDDVVERLGAICLAPYRVLGAAAPLLTNDAAVVRAHELARGFGAVALAVRERLGRDLQPDPLVERVLARAVGDDATGAFALYALAVVVAPRLLVFLRDARARVEGDDRELLDRASDLVVGEIVAIRDLAGLLGDAGQWRTSARELTDEMDAAGFAESLA
ncbi:MAG: hypothetical protein ACRDV0_03280 [Acidimicrobiales bacterium]